MHLPPDEKLGDEVEVRRVSGRGVGGGAQPSLYGNDESRQSSRHSVFEILRTKRALQVE